MQEREDEPEDVRNAKPVADAIEKGQADKVSDSQNTFSPSVKTGKPRQCCKKKELEIEKPPCCKKKKNDTPQKLPEPVLFCTPDPYKRLKLELIPRHCLTKNEHQNTLATPKYIRQTCNNCTEDEQSITRKIRVLYPRTELLSKPLKRRILMTIAYKGKTLPIKMVDHLIKLLEAETAITPEQAEAVMRVKQYESEKKIEKKKKNKYKRKSEKKFKNESVKETLGGGDPQLDLEVIECQYSMALRFVRSILNWKCSYPREDYCDIADIILKRLSKQLEYEPIGNEDRKSQQMQLLADIFACWISEILFEVAEKYCEELDNIAIDEENKCLVSIKDEDDDDDYSEEEDGYKEIEAKCKLQENNKLIQVDDDVIEDEEGEAGREGESTTSSDDCVDIEQQTEPKSNQECETATQTKPDKRVQIDQCCTANVKCSDQVEMEKIASRFGQTDVPFITFAKIFDTLYCMIGSEPENDMCCQIDNRIHRAIYEKFEEVIQCEDPKLLTERMKDVLNVVTGKLAKWLRKALNKRQIKFFDNNPAEVESKEIRYWAEWIDNIVNVADGWSNWIHKVTNEAQFIKRAGGTTHGHWQEWTGKFEKNALLWRRQYLEAVHQEHHNNMMLADRAIVKTCTKKIPQYSEMTIKNTNFESCSEMHN